VAAGMLFDSCYIKLWRHYPKLTAYCVRRSASICMLTEIVQVIEMFTVININMLFFCLLISIDGVSVQGQKVNCERWATTCDKSSRDFSELL